MTILLIIFAISAILIAYGGFDATRGKDNRETIKMSDSFCKPVFRYPIPIQRVPLIPTEPVVAQFEYKNRELEYKLRLDRMFQMEMQKAEYLFRAKLLIDRKDL